MDAFLSRRGFVCGGAMAVIALSTRRALATSSAAHADRYLEIVRAYADCLIECGQDVYGKEHSPLFAVTLDRRTLRLLEGDALEKAAALEFQQWGIRPHDRMLTGANPMHCENLYQVLYALTEITGEKRYADEADNSLKFFFEHCQSPATGLFYWGEHAGWDLLRDAPLEGGSSNTHEFYRPWVLWDRSWKLAPESCLRFARGLWEHQIGDQQTGLYSRHAAISRHGAGTDAPYPRHGGFYVETWAEAYKKTHEAVFLKAIETVVDCLERMRQQGGLLTGGSLKTRTARQQRDAGLAVSLSSAAASLPSPLAAKLRGIASANDLPASVDIRPRTKESSNLWSDGYGSAGGQIVSPANLLALRYRQSQPERYRQRILAVADIYLADPLNLSFPLHPGTIGKIIHLMLNAQEMTGDPRYLDRAENLAGRAVELFLPDGCPLPKATHMHEHYEAVTNADTLMMSLLQLWAARQNPPRRLPLVYTDR